MRVGKKCEKREREIRSASRDRESRGGVRVEIERVEKEREKRNNASRERK